MANSASLRDMSHANRGVALLNSAELICGPHRDVGRRMKLGHEGYSLGLHLGVCCLGHVQMSATGVW